MEHAAPTPLFVFHLCHQRLAPCSGTGRDRDDGSQHRVRIVVAAPSRPCYTAEVKP